MSVEIASLYASVSADTSQFDRAMVRVDKRFDGLGRSFGALEKISTGALMYIGTKVVDTVGKAFEKVGDVAKKGIDFNAMQESATQAFTTLLGDAQKAQSFLEDMQRFAKTTPFEYPDLLTASRRLMALGFSADDVLPTLTSVGDAVAALGGGQEMIDRVTLALGQMKTKGTVQAEEMLQLAENGIPAWEMLAKKLGVDIPTAMKMVEKRSVSAAVAIEAITEGIDQRFGGMMEKQSSTWGGLISNLQDTFGMVSGQVMKPIFEVAKRGLEWIARFTNTNTFTDGIARWTQNIQQFTDRFVELVVQYGPKGVAIFRSVSEWLGSAARDAFSFGTAMASRFAPVFQNIGNFLTDVVPGAYKKFRQIVDNVRDPGMAKTVNKLRSAFSGLGKVLGSLAQPFKDVFGGLFQSLMVARGSGWAGIFDTLKTRLMLAVSQLGTAINNTAIPFVLEKLKELGGAIKGWIEEVDWWDKIGEWAGKFGAWAGEVWTNHVSPALGTLWTNLTSWVTDEGKRTELWNNLVSAWNWLTSWASKVWEWAKPGLETAWGEISSWFTDPQKRTTIWNAVVGGWNVLTEWAGAIWDAVSPLLSTLWDSLSSWFTDENKRAILWGAVKDGWDILTEWAGKIWDWAKPGLTTGWNWLTSWFTDPQKRQEAWTAVQNTWTFLTEWASKVWGWMEPNLLGMWVYLHSWITDPSKREILAGAIQHGWTGFTEWATRVWDDGQGGGIKPHLEAAWTSMDTWIDTNAPNLKPWKDAFVDFAKGAADQWKLSFPSMIDEVTNFRTKVETEIPLIEAAFERLWRAVFGGGASEGGKTMVSFFEDTINQTSRQLGILLSLSRVVMESLAISIEATKAMWSGDFDRFWQLREEQNQKWAEFGSLIGQSFKEFLRSMGVDLDARAHGGRSTFGGLTLVGERGPELVNLPAGSYVHSNNSSMGMMGGTSRIDIYVHGDSHLPTDRGKIRELARELQKELQLSGARVLLA